MDGEDKDAPAPKPAWAPAPGAHGWDATEDVEDEDAHPPSGRGVSYTDLLVAGVLRASLLGPQFLDQELRARRRTMWKGKAFQGLSSSSNIQETVSMTWFQCFLFLMGAMLVYNFTNDVFKVGALGLQRYGYYRFTALETRDGNLHPSSPGISALGVDRRLFSYLWLKPPPPSRSRMTGMLIEQDGPSVTYRLLCASHALGCGAMHDGWWFQAGNVTSQHPVRYSLEGSDNLMDWTLVGASGMRRMGSLIRLNVEDRFDFPEVPGEYVSFKFRGQWHQVFYRMSWVVVGLGLLCNFIAGVTGSQQLTIKIMVVWILAASTLSLVATIWALSITSPSSEFDGARAWREPFNHARTFVQGAWLFFSIVFLDAFMDIAMLITGLLGLVWDIIIHETKEDIVGSEGTTGIWLPFACVMFSFSFVLLRFVRILRRRRLVEADNTVYTAAWEQVLREPGFKEGLQVLQQQVASLRRHTRSRHAIQLRRKGPRVMDVLGGRRASGSPVIRASYESVVPVNSRGVIDEDTSWRSRSLAHMDAGEGSPSGGFHFRRSRVADSQEEGVAFVPEDDLDVLFMQATVLQSKLLSYTVDHARQCGGKFALRMSGHLGVVEHTFPGKLFRQRGQKELFSKWAPSEFVLWDQAESPSDLVLGQVKPIRRILEKCDLVYQGHPCRMLDLCRQKLVFDTPMNIADCLQSISSDPSLVIMRVRSNMHTQKEGAEAEAEQQQQRDRHAQRESAYKFVSVSVRIVDEDTLRLGTDLHVCEILLELRHFAQVRTVAMHDRYKIRRTMEHVVHLGFGWLRRRDGAVNTREEAQRVAADLARSHDLSRGGSLANTFDTVSPAVSPASRARPVPSPGPMAASPAFRAPLAPSRALMAASPSSVAWPLPSPGLMEASPVSMARPAPSPGLTGQDTQTPGNALHGPSPASLEITPAPLEAPPPFGPLGSADSQAETPLVARRSSFILSLSRLRSGSSGRSDPRKGSHEEAGQRRSAVAHRGSVNAAAGRSARALHSFSFSASGLLPGVGEALREDALTSWGLAIPGRTYEALEHMTQLSSRGLRGHMDELLQRSNGVGLQDASFMSILYTSKPLAHASTKLFWRVIFLGILATYLQGLPRHVGLLHRDNQLSPDRAFSSYRLRVTETRAGAAASSAGVAAFGLIAEDSGHYVGRMPGCEGARTEGMRCVCAGLDMSDREAFVDLVWTEARAGASYTLFLNRPVSVRGWYLVTGEEGTRAEDDPARYEVLGSDVGYGDSVFGGAGGGEGEGEGEGWVRVGTPVWRALYNFQSAVVLTNLATALPLDRLAVVEYDLTTSTPFFLYRTLRTITFACGFLAYIVMGSLGWSSHANKGVLSGLVTMYVIVPVVIAGYVEVGQWRAACEAGLGTVGYVFLGAVFYDEARMRRWLPLVVAADFLASVLLDAVVFEADGVVLGASASVGYTVLLWLTIIGVLRLISYHKAKKLVEQDRGRYDDLWERLKAKEVVLEGLQHLDRVISMIGLDEKSPCKQLSRQTLDNAAQQRGPVPLGRRRSSLLRGAHAQVSFTALLPHRQAGSQPPQRTTNEQVLLRHHYQFQQQSAVLGFLGRVLLPNMKNVKKPIASLDQLYAQAYITQGLLMEKSKQWAEQSHGLFATKRTRAEKEQRIPPQYVRWEDAKEDTELQKRILWTTIKSKKRALEKVIRSYGNDVSRLMDISRTAIFFENISDMTMCLGEIAIDSEIYVERIKNRMSPKSDSESTAGYRDVLINLRITTPLAVALGIELHVCELQLVLKEFAELKHTNGHENYIKFRNSKAA